MSSAPDDDRWPGLATAPALALVAATLIWNVCAFAIDASSLEQGANSLGVSFSSVLLTVFYGAVPFVVAAGAAITARVAPPEWTRLLAWCGAAVVALCGLGLLAIGVLSVGLSAAEVVFGTVSVVLAPVLLAPLALCFRYARQTSVGDSVMAAG